MSSNSLACFPDSGDWRRRRERTAAANFPLNISGGAASGLLLPQPKSSDSSRVGEYDDSTNVLILPDGLAIMGDENGLKKVDV